jgi:hypothetical protein
MDREHRAQVLERAASSKSDEPLKAWYCQSDWATPNSSSPERIALMLKTDPPVASTPQRMPWLALSRLSSRQIAPPAG